MPNNPVAIIGAGITGLATAWTLKKSGKNADIFERKGEPGGAIKTVKNNDWQAEYGPNTLLLRYRKIKEFIDSVGLKGEMVTANVSARKRFIVKRGKPEPLPSSIISAIKTPLFSTAGKLRVLLEPFVFKNRNRDQSVADFVERRLGKDVLDYAINPFVAGIFAHKADELSLKHAFPVMDHLEQQYGTLIGGALAGYFTKKDDGKIPSSLISFKKGLQQLPLALATGLEPCYYNHEISKIEKRNDGWFINSQMGIYGPYEDVVINIPLYKWAENLLPVTEQQLQKLEAVEYPPLSVMLLGYQKDDIDHPLDGFGFLVPEKENRKVLGALFTSTLFEGRAPENHHLLTVFIGGGRSPELAGLDSDVLLKIIQQELAELLGVKGDPVFKDHVYWPKSIPKYHIGYGEILDTLNEIENEHQGLHLAGNFRNGISVPDCILNGIQLGESLAKKS